MSTLSILWLVSSLFFAVAHFWPFEGPAGFAIPLSFPPELKQFLHGALEDAYWLGVKDGVSATLIAELVIVALYWLLPSKEQRHQMYRATGLSILAVVVIWYASHKSPSPRPAPAPVPASPAPDKPEPRRPHR